MPTHTVQVLHSVIPPHCITARRGNAPKDANHTKRSVIGVSNTITIESTMALTLFFVIFFAYLYLPLASGFLIKRCFLHRNRTCVNLQERKVWGQLAPSQQLCIIPNSIAEFEMFF